MKIGIISDTHDNVTNTKEAVKKLQKLGISYLIHAGDIGQRVLEYLDSLDMLTIAVYGNTDRGLDASGLKNVRLHKPPYYFEIAKTTFKLMHEPYFLTPDSDVVVFGHLHKFSCEKAKSLFLNPGEVCAREKPRIECTLLDLDSMGVRYIYKEQAWKSEEVCA